MADLGGVGGAIIGASALLSGSCYFNACRVPRVLRAKVEERVEHVGQALRGAFHQPADEPPPPEIGQVLDQLKSLD